MAGKTFYFLSSAATGSNFGGLQDGGPAPGAASTSSWAVDGLFPIKYSRMVWNAQRDASTFTTSSQLVVGPDNTAADAWRTQNALSGNFFAGAWTFATKVGSNSPNGQAGHFRARIWAAASAVGVGAREITSGAIDGAQSPPIVFSGTMYDAPITWAAPAFSLNNEFLFVQVEWSIDVGAGGGGLNDVQFRVGPGISIATTNFLPPVLGTVAATEGPDIAAALGSIAWRAIGAATEGPDAAIGYARIEGSGRGAAIEAPDIAAGQIAIHTVLIVGAAYEDADAAHGSIEAKLDIIAAAIEAPDVCAGIALVPTSIEGAAIEGPDTIAASAMLGAIWPQVSITGAVVEGGDVADAAIAIGPIGNLEVQGVGGRLLYAASSPLERAIADVDIARMMAVPARLITENLDPRKVASKNLPFLAYGMGVTLWEPSWSETTRREWVADQWAFKQAVGSLPAFRMALAASGYDISDYRTPPGGFFVSRDLTVEETNAWLRQMPQIRIKFAKKMGVEGTDEMFASPDGAVGISPGPDCSYIDSAAIGLDDGRALYGNVAVLRYPDGHEVPLEMWERVDTTKTVEGLIFDQLSVPAFLPDAFFLGEDFVDDARYASPDDGAGRIYSFIVPDVKNVTTPGLAMTPLVPGLTPLSPRYEINSDIEYDLIPSAFCNDWGPNIEFITPDNGATLLAHCMYLLDPSIAAAMNAGISFVDDARIGIPSDYAEFAINTHTKLTEDAFVPDDNFVGESFFVPEDLSDFNRACRAVGASKALRDTVLVNFEKSLDA